LKGAAAVPAFSDDGILYSGGADWILYAYKLEDRNRARQHLLYGEESEGDYGTGNPGPSSWANYYFRFDEAELEKRFDEIRNAIKTGTIGSREKEYAAWLMETALSISVSPFRQDSIAPFLIRQRVEALRLLAYIGSRETIPFLVNLFNMDSEILVKTAAAEAIGKIGIDPEGFAIRAFGNAVFPPFPLNDEKALIAIAAATGALCRFSGPPLSDAGVRILTILSTYDRFPFTRNQAQRELRSLK
jgi:outer membrane protein assembly factor BamB